jgi:hypothetical protein
MNPIDSGRVVRSYTQHIAAPPARVFPLLCPVRENEWLDGWADGCEMIHSDSGVAEEGCVFRTRAHGQPETVWVVTLHEPDRGLVEFARVTAGLEATRLGIRVEAGPDGASSAVHITYSFTPLGAEGVAFAREAHSEEEFRRGMAWWEASMNHWFATGEMLRAAAR